MLAKAVALKRLFVRNLFILLFVTIAAFSFYASATASLPTATVTATTTKTCTPTSTITEIPEGYESPTVTATATVTTTAVPEIIELIKFETINNKTIDFDGNTITNRVHIVGSVSSCLMDHWTLEYK